MTIHEEIILEAKPREILYSIRKNFDPYIHRDIKVLHCDQWATVYNLQAPLIEGNTLTVYAIPFFIIAGTRQREQYTRELVFTFEVLLIDDTSIKLIGESKCPFCDMDDIFHKVWGAVLRSYGCDEDKSSR
jgi:hypothetical protein